MSLGTATELFGGFPGSFGGLQETGNFAPCGAMHESAEPAKRSRRANKNQKGMLSFLFIWYY